MLRSITRDLFRVTVLAVVLACGRDCPSAEPAAPRKGLTATAYAIPKETAPEGGGYFSIITCHDGKHYIGTHANAANAFLRELEPKAKGMTAVGDCQKPTG